MNIILVPIDFSKISRAVVAEAARLARLVKGRVILLNVMQAAIIVSEPDGMMLDDGSAYLGAARKAATRHLDRLRAKLQKGGIAAGIIQSTGFPVWQILQQAKKLSATYIVMGSHGHTAFYDLLVGSTTSGVLKRATCPVVVVPAPGKPKSRAATRRR